jgi:hypothetical protein
MNDMVDALSAPAWNQADTVHYSPIVVWLLSKYIVQTDATIQTIVLS